MAVRGEVVLTAVRELCPTRFAVEGDKTGLQVGRCDKNVSRVLCTLDLTQAVAEEARDLGAELVISHHAVIFRSLRNLRTDSDRGRLLETLIKADVAVYVPHTALDVVDGGGNDFLADAVGLRKTRFLQETGRDSCELLLALAGDQGDAACARALETGALSAHADEATVHVVAPVRRTPAIVKALSKLLGEAPRVLPLNSDAARRGIGRVGSLAKPEPLMDLAARLKESLGVPGVRIAAASDALVSRVAVLCGDGRSYVDAAIFAGADVMVTGDVDHHTALAARARGLSLIDVGHWGSERQVVRLLTKGLTEKLADDDVEVIASGVDTNPFAFV